MKSLKILLGEQIRNIRKACGLTQEQLAELLEIDQKQVSCIERGINTPSMDRLQKIAEVLDVSVRDLFDFGKTENIGFVAKGVDAALQELDEDKRKIAYQIFMAAISSLKEE